MIVARLSLDRADRTVISRSTTLRDRDMKPFDVVLDDLSVGGCRFSVDLPLELGSMVSIGIPGLGNCFAQIRRADCPTFACSFVNPITEAAIARVRTVDTVVEGNFQTLPSQGDVAISPVEEGKLPVTARLATIALSSAILWAGLISLFWR